MENILIDILENNYEELKGLYDILDKFGIRNKIKEKFDKINKNVLYSSMFHGLHHSQKVCLFAWILAVYQNFSEKEIELVTDAAIYHDMGRQNDSEDSLHGYVSALKIETILSSIIYDDPKNKGYIKSIIDAHSCTNPNAKQSRFDYYQHDYPDMDFKQYEKYHDVLLDADAIDRTRFKKTCMAALNEKYLILPCSKKIISIAEKVNNFIARRISEMNLHNAALLDENKKSDPRNFYHGIGVDFFAFKSILINGILSNYEALQRNTEYVTNFNGNNNGDFWISVVECEKGQKGKAYHNFIKDNIAFLINANKWHSGSKIERSEAKDLSLSIDSGEYDDERFIFRKIDPTSILGIRIPINNPIGIASLQYLNCSYNIDIIKRKIAYYIKQLKIECGYDAPYEECAELIMNYQQEVVSYEKMSVDMQKQQLDKFICKCKCIIEKMNSIVQGWMAEGWSKKLGISSVSVTVIDVINSILTELNIEYDYSDDGTIKLGISKRR